MENTFTDSLLNISFSKDSFAWRIGSLKPLEASSVLAERMEGACSTKTLDLQQLRSLSKSNLVRELTKSSRRHQIAILGLTRDIDLSANR